MNETMNKPYIIYANKLMHFLHDGSYDNDTLCLLGVMSKVHKLVCVGNIRYEG